MAKHLEHLETLLITKGTAGVKKFLQGITLASLKWDGIATIGGYYPGVGPFVSTKSFFNKVWHERYVFYSAAAIDDHLADKPKLAEKLKHVYSALSHFSSEKPLVNQGDILWYPGNFQDINGYRHFFSNILHYSIPLEMIEYNQEVGVAWHTQIEGKDLMTSSPYIWSRNFTMPFGKDKWAAEYEVNEQFDFLVTDPALQEVLLAYLTWCYSNQQSISMSYFAGSFYYTYSNIKVNELKTDKGRKKRYEKYFTGSIPIYWHQDKIETLQKEFDHIISIKENYLWYLNDNFSFIKRKVQLQNQEPRLCQHEGFVLNSSSGSIKLVDRYQFSRLNRDTNIVRAWDL